MRNTYTLVSGVVFGAVAVLQALRVLKQWSVQIGPFTVPIWFSWIAVVIAGGLCVWAFKSGRS